MQTTRVPKQSVSSERIAELLEANGWLRSVAGDDDFDKACKAIVAMYANGRGLFLTGNAGCGKTQLMKALFKIERAEISRWLYTKNQQQMMWLKENHDFYIKSDIFIDDFGAEEVKREYGNTIDVVGDFIQVYHTNGKGRFFSTTNLNSQQINERYGGRILDRILEMCVILKLNSKSKRERIVI